MTRYPAPPFVRPEPHGFLYLGFTAEPQRPPFYRLTPGRRRAAERLVTAARTLAERPEVASARVFRAVFIPPLPGAPRHDLAMLVRTSGPGELAPLRASAELAELGGEVLLAGTNAARIGETEAREDAVFLFNHFTAESGADPVAVWRGLAGWYTAKTGIDNSTALRSEPPSRFPFVNYARLPGGALPFLVNQLARPSFHRFVRATLAAEGMAACPAFHRLVR
ncbi:hypothetical protein [Allonocardiopsis opalescens]|uniref:Uncharacterized protein n=1 Tax=Allonocardiopsis opalescens TaxID=1144618 RepID=A0A2T0Q1N3_9ACTN|nr:hypothetical protein [Allonocardiopsis opalescens]PRX97707.1 hypothetical protein CLV72_10557 [Allonocardiopsis opalescens]